MAEDNNAIRITNREVYDGLMQVRDRLLSLESRVDLVTGQVLKENTSLAKRVRSLELRYYAVLAGLVGTLASVGLAIGGSL